MRPVPPSHLWLVCSGTAASSKATVLLPCPAPLAPSGVHPPTAASAASCSPGPTLLIPPRPLVLSCLAPLWSSYAPSGPVLPGSTAVLSPSPMALLRAGPVIFL